MNDRKQFDNILKFTLKSEGGYVNDPDDPGGATNKGITQKTYSAYLHDYKELPSKDVKDISDEEVSDIYFIMYWEIANCDIMPFPVAEVVFDTAVNCGVTTTKKMLQRALDVDDDGAIGKKTLNKLLNSDPFVIADTFLGERRNYYDIIIVKNNKLEKYRKGWNNRIDELKKYIVEKGENVC